MDQSTPPWRVFDAPSGEGAAVAGTARAGGPAAGSAGAAAGSGGLIGQPWAVAALGASILIGALAVVVAIGGGGNSVASGPEASIYGSGPPTGDAGELVVDVAGAVVAPGVYRLPSGARVGDAVDAAGGFSPRVDADRVATELNLAALLGDGQQVRVPSRDDDQAAASGAGGGGGPNGTLINLNSATQAELESLPGIGPVTAGKIIESRAQTPFRTVDELRERGLVGEKTFDAIKALVTVG
jgi:competence protein ComEA